MEAQLISYPQNKTIVDLFLEQVSKTPNNIAVEFEGLTVTYRELNERSNQLAHYLRARGVKEEDLIPICLHRSIDMIVASLGVLKAGAAYVPVDPDYPIERIEYVIKDTSAEVILTETGTPITKDIRGLIVVYLDTDFEKIQQEPIELPINDLKPDNLAYVIYTSGSTGKPKGVLIEHRNVVRLFVNDKPLYDFNENDVWTMFHSFCFDFSVWEMYGALLFGGKVIIIPKEVTKESETYAQLLIDKSVTILNQTPSAFYVLQEYILNQADTIALRYVIFGGEALNPSKLKYWKQKYSACKLINMYGITETTVHVTFQLIEDRHCESSKSIIGQPIPTLYAYVLDSEQNIIGYEQEGELYIGGAGLARGYLNLQQLTEERFIKDPFSNNPNARLYKTGDLAKINKDGALEYLGRSDDQVKLRGFRIELGEIESILQESENVKQAVVVAKGDLSENKRLIGYVVPNGLFNKDAIINDLQAKLPDYMVPCLLMELKEIPLTPNGKIDKKNLPNPDAYDFTDTVYVAPKTDLEKTIINSWKDLLQIERIGIHDNFFELGGNSLLGQKMVSLISTKNINLPITKLYQYPTAYAIAHYLEGLADTQARKHHATSKQKVNDIAVIAMAGRFPGANTIDELWDNLKGGRETIRFFSDDELDLNIPHSLKHDPNYVKARGIIDGADEFDSAFFGINSKLAEVMDPQQRKFLEISWEALEAAGYLSNSDRESIGVYAGSSSNTYFINNIHPNQELTDLVGDFNILTLSDKDFLATRVAYTLNLKGPAITVQSACSTSLLAIAEAVEAIRSNQCTMALAGGVAINAPIKSGHLYEEGAILSNDGHCRTFDKEARGTLFSDGAAVVLLKDRKQAELDGDHIYAVVKGIGISNDGGFKGSFTAPSAEGQAACISKAIHDAQVEPASISYIEAHGTATPIGDPIEIEGLNIAFGSQERKQYCAIGSIKSNMGHLTQAAGVAGFIKACLSLYHKQIPPSINFDSPNPNLPLKESPFFVNNKLTDWSATDRRRAGVSSFGVGGTNVHIVLEEYPALKAESSTGRPFELVTWSAKNEKSREDYAVKLHQHLNAQPDEIADVAYTLHLNKPAFNHRRFVVASDRADLISKLNLPPTTSECETIKETYQRLAFVFPGQGAQYINMGKSLYQNEPIFKEAIDTCSELLKAEIDEDIRAIIYPELETPQNKEQLNNTYYAQPALFITGYALARLWMSLGLRPDFFIGHSIGEFVAAHLAGVFSLKDALHLIATRAKLMTKLPRGSMLAVRENHELVRSAMSSDLSISAINSPNLCVVAGPVDSIRLFSEELNKKGILSKLLNTSHAFHSQMMDPIVPIFKEVVKSVKLNAPDTPFISTVTGEWIKDSEATDPAYWSNHLRSTVRFSDAVKTLIEEDEKILILEAGPKNSSTILIRQQAIGRPVITVPGIDCSPDQQEYYSFLKTVGQLWLNGAAVNWNQFYSNQKRNKVHNLPTYAFEKRVCWINPPLKESQTPSTDTKSNEQIVPENKNSSDLSQIDNQNMTSTMRKAELIRKVKEILESASGIDTEGVDPDASFLEIGLDSLLLTQLALTLKKEFKLPITFRKLSEEYSSISLLASYLDQNLPKEKQENPIPSNHTNGYEYRNGTPADLTRSANIQTTQNNNGNSTAIGLIAQQIQLIAQQISLLQNNQETVPSFSTPPPVITNKPMEAQEEITAEEAIELKKPFGATAKIEKQSKGLSAKQQEYLDSLIARYNTKTQGSKNYTQEHRSYMADPRVVSGFRPPTKEIVYQLVVNKSKGSRLWDIDGNEYIDMLNSFGANMLGYQPDFIKNALIEQIENGYEIGPQHVLAGEVSKLICEFTKHDRAALCNTGSEAVLGAMRIARTVTGRSLIVAFTGSYHGITDEVLVRGTKKLKSFPAASGIMPEAVQNMLILDYGTAESLEIIKKRADEIAAVLVEPVQSRRPEFQPIEFLKDLRAFTSKAGIALVFDEIITGFRMHPGGVQALFDIKADIATYGKVVGGGISIGIIAGKKEYMDALDGGHWQYGDDSYPEVGVTYFAGTFVRHPLALATARASLLYMKEKGPKLQEDMNQKTRELTDKLQKICTKHGLPIYIARFGSLWKIKYKEEYPYSELLFTLMREKGVHIWDGFPCFIIDAHTQEELEFVIQKFEESVEELLYHDFIPSEGPSENQFYEETISLEIPPAIGALLGKDENGDPAWFIPDENIPGKYLQLNA